MYKLNITHKQYERAVLIRRKNTKKITLTNSIYIFPGQPHQIFNKF